MRKLIEPECHLGLREGSGAVVEQESVAVRTENERDIQRRGVRQGLLHAGSHRVIVVFRLNESDGEVRLTKKQVVSALSLPPSDELAANDNSAVGEAELTTPSDGSPSGPRDSWRYVAIADIGFG